MYLSYNKSTTMNSRKNALLSTEYIEYTENSANAESMSGWKRSDDGVISLWSYVNIEQLSMGLSRVFKSFVSRPMYGD